MFLFILGKIIAQLFAGKSKTLEGLMKEISVSGFFVFKMYFYTFAIGGYRCEPSRTKNLEHINLMRNKRIQFLYKPSKAMERFAPQAFRHSTIQ